MTGSRGVTTAWTASPQRSSGTANAAASATAGWRSSVGLDLERVDVLAARDDHVLRAVDEVEVAVLVGGDDVAGAVPAVDERLGGRVRAVPVAEHDVRPADPQLARLALRPPHLGLDARHRRADRGEAPAAAAVVLGREVGDGRRGLGHPVELGDVAVRQPLEHAALELGRDRRGGVLDVPQRREVGGVGARRVEQHREHRRHEHGVGDPLALDRLEHGGGVEAREQRPAPRRPTCTRAGSRSRRRGTSGTRAASAGRRGGRWRRGCAARWRAGCRGVSITPFGRPGRAAGVGDGGERVGREVARRDAAGRRRRSSHSTASQPRSTSWSVIRNDSSASSAMKRSSSGARR